MKAMHVNLVIWMITILMVSGNAQARSAGEIPEIESFKSDLEEFDRDDISIRSVFDEKVAKLLIKLFKEAYAAAEKRQKEQENLAKNAYENGIDVYPDVSSSTGLAFINNPVQDYSELAKIETQENRAFFFTEELQRILKDPEAQKNILGNDAAALQDIHGKDVLEDKILKKIAGKFLASKIGIECNFKLFVPSEDLISCEDQRNSSYRTINGSCNNLLRGRRNFGAKGDIQIRLVAAGYEDEFNAPRITGKNGRLLRNARNISLLVFPQERSVDDDNRSQMFVSWGQLIDHDVTEGVFPRGYNDTAISCCSLPVAERQKRVACASAINLTGNIHDPVFPPNRTCMNMVRTVGIRKNRCKLGIRHQINEVTSYIDGSAVYGSDEEIAKSLRTFKDGQLKTSTVNGRTLLPFDDKPEQCVLDDKAKAKDLSCFLAGDVRVNEQPGLSSVHTFFVLFHNKLASELSSMRTLTDEDVYQIIRKLVGGFQQIVTYDEWLPLLIGRRVMKIFRLSLDTKFNYRAFIDPAIQTPFTTAAFRMGHSLVSPSVILVDKLKNTNNSSPLEGEFFNPGLVLENIEGLVLGGLSNLAQKADGNFIGDLQNQLFGRLEDALDLMALNIQRGRDHGLPGYLEYTKLCGFNDVTGFSQLSNHSRDSRRRLRRVYDHVEDIDLFPGAITEQPADGSILGPTFTCLIANQFQSLKFGDRYWFQNEQPFGLTSDQIKNLRDVGFAGALCQTFGFHEVNENVFDTLSVKRNCATFPKVNLGLFVPVP